MTNNINTYSIKNSQWLGVLLLILLSAIMWSCTYEDIDNAPSIVDKGKTITFTFKIPGGGSKGSGPSTYALSGENEYEVNQIAVLFFDKNGLFIYQPTYLSSDDIIISADDGRKLTFTIQVYENINDIVVLVNSNQILNNALSSIAGGQTREEVLKEIVLSNPSKWNAIYGSSGYMPIPMWAEVNNLSLGDVMPSNVSVPLVRMVSKIDVALTTPEAQNNFSLESVSLYNYNDKGYVAPYESNWDNAEYVVTAPSIPLLANKPLDPVNSPLVYKEAAITKEADRGISCINEIYTFETLAGSDLDFINNTCLVVGGKFTGDSETTYYRYDFANTTGVGAEETTDYYSLLRNHNYKINITKVKGSGLPTAEAAFNSRPFNMEATVLQWNIGQIGDINFDGQYMLGVSDGAFTFSREARYATSTDNALSITTDYPTGWKLIKIVDAEGADINSATNQTSGWLGLTPSNGASGETTNTHILLSENNSNSTRNGFIHLSAGRLTYIVKVNQLATANLAIAITDVENVPIDVLEFTSKKGEQPAQQQFKLNWLPASSSLTYINTPQGNPFVFASGAGLDNIVASGTIDPSGEKTLTIRPTTITDAELNANPFYERNSTLLYTISDGTAALFKSIALRQYVPTVIPKVDEMYKMDGTLKTFKVRSNSPFTVTVKTDPDNVITSGQLTTTGEVNTSVEGTPVIFNIKDDTTNPQIFQSDVVVTIKSPTNLFDDYDVTLKCRSAIIQNESNSYIVAPDGLGILIPVSRANKSILGNQLTGNNSFTSELVWTDNSKGLKATSNIKMVKSIGTGPSGYIYIIPGSASGNALVAIKSGEKILWSWHIWVTNYEPTPSATGGFMDRNLGAIGNTAGAVATKGFVYQWGRKDPFISSNSVKENSPDFPLYNAVGQPVKITTDDFSSGSNFGNSVANPTIIYRHVRASAGANNEDWIGDNSNRNSDLWGRSSAKTVYDPCPVGWRVPIIDVLDRVRTIFTWGNYGVRNDDYGGYYPAAGSRKGDGAISNSNPIGGIYEVGVKGWYWSASASDKQANYISFYNNGSDSSYRNRANGYSVRCVKEQ